MIIRSEGYGLTVKGKPEEIPPGLSVYELAARAFAAGKKWVAAGAPLVTEELFAARLAACQSCDAWNPKAFLGAGQCTRCGCSRMKLHLATETCPHPAGSRWPVDNPRK